MNHTAISHGFAGKTPISRPNREVDEWGNVNRAVRLIEIEIKSRFEIARFLNRFIARFFSAPLPQPPAVCYPNQSECSRTEQTVHTDRQCAKETGKMSSEQDKDLVAKKNACCIFPSEQRASFWRLRSARSYAQRRWLSTKCPFGNLLIPESVE